MLRHALVDRGVLAPDELYPVEPAPLAAPLRVHDADYVHGFINGTMTAAEVRKMGFPWSEHLVARTLASVNGTVRAAWAALDDGVSGNLAGGTHHAFAGRGQGYCVFNDSAVAARVMQEEGRARRVVILDCDVHQGNGTARILQGDPTIFTFSIHGARNFPFRKEQSDLDVALPDQTGDAEYLTALERGLEEALERAGAGDGSLDLAIYVAGADPYEHDTLGRLALTKQGLARRDRMVLAACRRAGVALAISMAGGYARELADIVSIHAATVRVAAEFAGLSSNR